MTTNFNENANTALKIDSMTFVSQEYLAGKIGASERRLSTLDANLFQELEQSAIQALSERGVPLALIRRLMVIGEMKRQSKRHNLI